MRKSTRPQKSPPIRPRKTYMRRLDGGIMLEGEVSPCVFMYPGYPLQLRVTLRRQRGESLGDAYAVDRSKTAATATEADAARLLEPVRIVSCRRCAAPAFDPDTIETNRAMLCESCFLSDLEAEFAKAQEAERQELAEHDRRRKHEGMMFRVSAWVHPEQGGDDDLVHYYFAAAPTDEQIRALLGEAGSALIGDYRVIPL
jgi:hypothetical protein